MNILALVLMALLISGCNKDSVAPAPTADGGEVVASTASRSATAPAASGFTATKDKITLDPLLGGPGRKTLFFGLGSVTLEVVGLRDGFCVFDYAEEVEGGYTTRRFRVPTSGPAVWVKRDGTDGFAGQFGARTSFDPARGEVLGGGNLHNGHVCTPATKPAK